MDINNALAILNNFAADPLFVDKFAFAFGITITPEQYSTALTTLPAIEVRTDAELQGAKGAFSAQTGKIYLTNTLVNGNPAQFTAVLIEEIGHYLDYYFNGNHDSDGDEGDIFSRLVRGETIDQTTLQGLKAENDHATITLDGQVIAVEQVAPAPPPTNNSGFTINGITAGDQLGFSVSSAGDVNGDGLQDIILGAFAAPGGAYSGVSYVIFGSNQVFSNGFDLSTLNGTNGFAINGSNSLGFSGYSVSSAGDIDNDGKGDLVIGSPFANQSHVIFGNTTFSPVLNTSNLGNNGFSVTSSEVDNIFGTSVSSAGDINNDGYDDLIFGAPWSDFNGTDSGSAYILYGRSQNDFLNYRNSVGNPIPLSSNVLKGISAGDNFGNSVSEAGDFNNDGIADIIIGAPLASPNGNTNAGQSFLLFGNANFSYPALNTLNGTNGIIFNGVTANGQSGYTVSNAGDVNNDNISDIIIGAPFEGAGKAYVVFGSNQGFSANFNLSSLNGTNGFVINGKTTGDGFGISVSSAGDVNADGIDDVIIGANTVDTNGTDSGESYVIYGRSNPFPASVNVANLSNSEGFTIQGTNAGDQSGVSVSGVGDFNGDQVSDVVIGSHEADPNGTSSGQAHVVFGKSSIPIDPNTGLYYRPGQLVVQFKAGVTEAQIQAIAVANGAISVENMVASGSSLANDYAQWRILNFNLSDDLLSIQSNLANNAQVEANIFNYFVTLDSSIPNDPQFPYQWALNNANDRDIDAPEAWCKQKGSKSVVVAVLDTGISAHPDLAGNVISGADFTGSGSPNDTNGHGTQVAGVIGAVGHNNTGIIGVSPNVSLMPVKIGTANTVLNGTQTGATITNVVNGMNYAINNEADIINASWSLDYPLQNLTQQNIARTVVSALKSAFQKASDNGILVVTSAGNNSINIDNPSLSPPRIFLPAAFSNNVLQDPLDTATFVVPDFDNIIVVSASNQSDALAPNSNFGGQSVDLAAPGDGIKTTNSDGGYTTVSGTSMAAAHVSGAAALLLAENPSLTPAQIIDALNNSVDVVGNATITGGRLNVNNALMSVGPVNNQAPIVNNPILTTGKWRLNFSAGDFQAPFNHFLDPVFKDPDGDGMSYTAMLKNGDPWPSWLTLSYDQAFNSDDDVIYLTGTAPAGTTFPIEIQLTATDCWGASTTICFQITQYIDGQGWGDVHFVTFDGRKYDMQEDGEFIFIESNSGDWQIQTRQQPWVGNPTRASVNTAFATKMDGHTVIYDMYNPVNQNLKIDGVNITLNSGQTYNVGNSIIKRNNNVYTFTYAGPDGILSTGDDDRFVATQGSSYINLKVYPASYRANQMKGLLGNADGNSSNDFVLRDGTQLPSNISFADIHQVFAQSWRVTQAESLFGTPIFDNPNFPSYFTKNNIPPQQWANAVQAARNAGIPEKFVEEVAFDFYLGGEDPAFLGEMAQIFAQSITLGISPSQVSENGNNNLVYTFTRTGSTDSVLIVNYEFGGTATIDNDYTVAGASGLAGNFGSISFGVGESTKTLIIDPIADNLLEGNETIAITLVTAPEYTIDTTAPVVGSITDDYPSINLTVSPTQAKEDGTNNLVYTFTRTGNTNFSLAVDYQIGGTAIRNTDYTISGASSLSGNTGTITFAAGETSKQLTIDPTPDTIIENDETVSLTLAANPNYTINTTTPVTGTITNDDFSISLAVSPSQVTEDGTNNLIYTFTRTGDLSSSVTVSYLIGGTAIRNTDYTISGASSLSGNTGTITFAAGETSKQLTIDPTPDTIIENDETVSLTLAANPNYTINTTTPVTGVITNDDQSISLAVSPSQVTEDGTNNLVYTFTRTGDLSSSVTVSYLIGGTAIRNTDYTISGASSLSGNTGTLTFAAGQTTKQLVVDPTPDTIVENNETVSLTLAANPNYTINTFNSVTGIITNDDQSISLAVSPSQVTEDGNNNLVYTFTRTGNTNFGLAVDYQIGGTAALNNDYTIIGASSIGTNTGTITFAPGQTTKQLIIDSTPDTIVENNETVSLTLATNPNYTINTTTPVTGIIMNDDFAGSGEIRGFKWFDVNGNGSFEPNLGETRLAGFTIFLDTNNNGRLDAGERSTVTDAQGQYAFTGLNPGNYTVEEVVPTSWRKTFPTPTTNYVVNLKTGAISGSHPGISVISAPTDSNNDGYREVVLKLNYQSGFKTAKFLIEYDKSPTDWTVNIGDSRTNNGYKGDSGTQSNDAEVQIVNRSLAAYSNDFAPANLRELANAPNLIPGPSVLELNVSDGHLDWNNNNGRTGGVDSSFLYALNGQRDREGSVNYDIFAAFNRVIDGTYRIGSGVRQVTIQVSGSHKINLGAGQVVQNINFGNQPQRQSLGRTGRLIDGPIAGAKIGFDANKNGIIDNDEPFALTDASGNYDLEIPDSFDTNSNGQLDPSEGNLLAIGGIDTTNGIPLTTPLIATPDATVVSPLSSLIAELVKQGSTLAQANAQVAAAFSIPAGVDINTLDPIVATNTNQTGGVETFAAMVQVQNFITQTMGLVSGASNLSNAQIVAQVVTAIADTIQSNTPVDLANSQQLETLLTDVGTLTNTNLSAFVSQSAQVMAEANQKIDDLVTNSLPDTLEESFAKVQKVALGETTKDLNAAGAGTKAIADVVSENTGTSLDIQIANAQVLSQAPTALNLSQTSIAENQAIGTQIGTFSTVDPDIGETYTYTLLNDSPFTLNGDRLLTSQVFDYETQDSYSILVQVTDGNGGVLQTSFAINVTDVTEINIPDVNEISGTPGRDILTGTPNADIITGFQGNDVLTGNGGNDQFVYISLTDAGDTIKDFTPGQDQIVLTQLLSSLGYSGSNPIADGYVQFSAQGSNSSFLRIDADGFAGSSPSRSFIFVENVPLAALNVASNFVF